ncbi:hypothetical protein P5705_10815 [Pseudomonas entomophila]|uniref:hypothetical protein n=1 Tax=Pseudomonas entomophila TaxID=312306 RepID=UPI0024053072|nr:hypothetical protein [Pseudomonas entomophila]MDF9618135.1 hypothetical protein [Pseudomonas entomophila]
MSKLESAQTDVSLPTPGTAASSLRLLIHSPDKEVPPQDTQPFKLCHGADHTLEVQAPGGSTWVKQKTSLHWMSTGTLPSHYGLSANPEFFLGNTDAEKHYQILSATGAEWQLKAQHASEGTQSGDVTLALGSYWQAPKYEIKASVGDFHYGFKHIQWSGVLPIIEEGDEIVLAVTVASVFDDKRVLAGKSVTWELGVGRTWTIPTDENGRSELRYTPVAEDLGGNEYGTLTFTATGMDDLQLESRVPQGVRAYLTSPWANQLQVFLDKKEITDFKGPGLRLSQSQPHTLMLKPREDSDFLGHLFTLKWPEGTKDLGITFTPSAPQEMTKGGIEWAITGGDTSGFFVLEATTLMLGGSFPMPGAQMSSDLAEEATLEIENKWVGQPPIFNIGVLKEVRIVPKQDSPLARMGLKAQLSIEGPLPTTFAVTPPFWSDVVTESGFTWGVLPQTGYASSVNSLKVVMPGFQHALKLERFLKMNRSVRSETRLERDGKGLGLTVEVFKRGSTVQLTLVPKSGSPLGTTTLKAHMVLIEGSLTKDDVTAEPAFGEPRPMTETGLSWAIKSPDKSGSFTVVFEVEGFEESWVLPVIVLSEKLSDEIQVLVKEQEVTEFEIQDDRQVWVRILPRAGSPIANTVFASLTFVPDSLSKDKVKANPAYDHRMRIDEGTAGLYWVLSGQGTSGTFGLKVNVDSYEENVDLYGEVKISKPVK